MTTPLRFHLEIGTVTVCDFVGSIQENLKGIDFRSLKWSVAFGMIDVNVTDVFNPTSDIWLIEQDFCGDIRFTFSENDICGKSVEHLLCMIRLKFPGTSFQKLVLKSNVNGIIEVTKIQ